MTSRKSPPEEFTDAEIERRMAALIRQGKTSSPKSLRDYTGTTPRAKAAAQKRAASKNKNILP